MNVVHLVRKNGIACRAEDKLTFLVPGGNAPGLISRFGIEWTVSLSSLRTITILTPRWQFALFISFRRHDSSYSISLGKVVARPGDIVCSVTYVISNIFYYFSRYFANWYGSSALDSLNIANRSCIKLLEKESEYRMFYYATSTVAYF